MNVVRIKKKHDPTSVHGNNITRDTCEVLQQQYYFISLVIEDDRVEDEIKPAPKILTASIKISVGWSDSAMSIQEFATLFDL